MKNFKRVAIVLMMLVLATAIVLGAVACNQPVTVDTTFVLEVRRFNGADGEGWTAVPKLDGELLCSMTVKVEAGQTNVSEALTKVATMDGSIAKVDFGNGDYLLFDTSKSWYLYDGAMSKEPAYIADDFANSYMFYNGAMSNGVTADALDGLTVYTIVVDGWDGNTGVAKVW